MKGGANEVSGACLQNRRIGGRPMGGTGQSFAETYGHVSDKGLEIFMEELSWD
jgi:hypothetical protein